MAFMGWLGVIFVWFVLTVLRGKREYFAFGAAAAAFALIVGLHIVNPDALIVRANAARAAQSQNFDAGYAASLSADAVPALVAALPSLPPAAQGQVSAALLPLWSQNKSDWRSWNWGRRAAFSAVQSQKKRLQASLPRPPAPAPVSVITARQTTTIIRSRKAGP